MARVSHICFVLIAELLAAATPGCTGEVMENPGALSQGDGSMGQGDGSGPDVTAPPVKTTGYSAVPDQGVPDGLSTSWPDQAPPKGQDQGTPVPSQKDGAGPPPPGDLWPAWTDFTAPDLAVSKIPGGACPCAAGLLCWNTTCRATCNKPTDPCQVTSNCPAGQACVSATYAGKVTYVCLPGLGLGKACAKAFCADNRVCGSVNGAPHVCLATCTKAFSACGTGGVCLKSTTTSCHFCTKP